MSKKSKKNERLLKSYEDLMILGCIKYDAVITRETFESVLNRTYTDGWEWLGPFLTLWKFIEKEMPAFCSTKNLPSGYLRILPKSLMSGKSSRIQDSCRRREDHCFSVMINTNISDLENMQQRRHLNEICKLQMAVNRSKSALSDVEDLLKNSFYKK
jgi:hypothetical protein